jgi:hypothetical protein
MQDLEELGVHVIRNLHELSRTMSGVDAFNFRMEFYTKLIASDLVLCVKTDKIEDALDLLQHRITEIYLALQDKDTKH